MNRQEFMFDLNRRLSRLPEQDRAEALNYYNEYFEEAGPEAEAEVAKNFGDPAKVAAQIMADSASMQLYRPPVAPAAGGGYTPYTPPYHTPVQPQSTRQGLSLVWWILLGIFAVPVAFPLVIAAAAVIFSLLVALFVVLIAFGAVAVALMVAGVISLVVGFGQLFTSLPTGILLIGYGMIIIALFALVVLFLSWAFPKFTTGLAGLASKMYNKIKGRKAQ